MTVHVITFILLLGLLVVVAAFLGTVRTMARPDSMPLLMMLWRELRRRWQARQGGHEARRTADEVQDPPRRAA